MTRPSSNSSLCASSAVVAAFLFAAVAGVSSASAKDTAEESKANSGAAFLEKVAAPGHQGSGSGAVLAEVRAKGRGLDMANLHPVRMDKGDVPAADPTKSSFGDRYSSCRANQKRAHSGMASIVFAVQTGTVLGMMAGGVGGSMVGLTFANIPGAVVGGVGGAVLGASVGAVASVEVIKGLQSVSCAAEAYLTGE